MRLYVAGPMTHIPQFNFPAFDAMAQRLRDYGNDVICPSELDNAEDRAAAMASPDGSALDYGNGVKATWGDFLARDVKLLADDGIEAVVVLPGWQNSRGARLETFVANALCGLPVFTWDNTYNVTRPVPTITLYRAWCSAPELALDARFGGKAGVAV